MAPEVSYEPGFYAFPVVLVSAVWCHLVLLYSSFQIFYSTIESYAILRPVLFGHLAKRPRLHGNLKKAQLGGSQISGLGHISRKQTDPGGFKV